MSLTPNTAFGDFARQARIAGMAFLIGGNIVAGSTGVFGELAERDAPLAEPHPRFAARRQRYGVDERVLRVREPTGAALADAELELLAIAVDRRRARELGEHEIVGTLRPMLEHEVGLAAQ